MGSDSLAKLGQHPPKSVDRHIRFFEGARSKTDDRAKAPPPRKSNAGDQDQLRRLELKKQYKKNMEKFCSDVEAKIPAAPPHGRGNPSRWDTQFSSLATYLDKQPYIHVSGRVGNILTRDVYTCYQYRLNEAYELEEKAYQYNNSKQGQAELQRETDRDNARLRAWSAKYHPNS